MSKFQDTINRLVPSLSREELADFVLNISRKIPEEFRTTFLRELQRVRVTVARNRRQIRTLTSFEQSWHRSGNVWMTSKAVR